jgi:hypothetical protein
MFMFASASALVSSLLAAPIAADVFAYRTEDGVFAYTDDHDKVPARYAADVVTVRDSKLQAYPRLTIEDTDATRAVADRLEKRLDYLRQANAASPAERAVAANAAGPGTVISIPTGPTSRIGKDGGFVSPSPSIEVVAGHGDEPVIVEPILTKEGDRVRTRRATIVKQGDKVLAIMMGRSHHVDVTRDIYDEDTLLQKR